MDADLLALYNDQIAVEQAAARSYRQMAAWCDAHDWAGAARWFLEQSVEETAHADRFIEFVLDRDEEVVMQGLPAPTPTFDSLLACFETALAQEQDVTEAISRLYRRASEVGDYRSMPLLNAFLEEQVEEEASVSTIVGELTRVADDPSATLIIDQSLPARRAAEEA